MKEKKNIYTVYFFTDPTLAEVRLEVRHVLATGPLDAEERASKRRHHAMHRVIWTHVVLGRMRIPHAHHSEAWEDKQNAYFLDQALALGRSD